MKNMMMNTITLLALYILLSYTVTYGGVYAFSSSGVGANTARSASSSLFNKNRHLTVISTERSMASFKNGKKRKNTQMNMFRRKQDCNDNSTRGASGAVRKWGKNLRLRHVFKSVLSKVQHKTHLINLWTRRHKSRTVVTAMLFFSTILQSTSFTNIVIKEQEQQQQQIQATATAKSSVTNVQQLVNRGGGGTRTSSISSSRPGQGMRNFLQQKKRQNLPLATVSTPAITTPTIEASSVQEVVEPTPSFESEVQQVVQEVVEPTSSFESEAQQVVQGTTKTLKMALSDLQTYMSGPKSDTLLLLLATSLITPLCKKLGTSPILGFLAAGMALGPNALGLISGIHTTETLAELGIVFFLFEMGIELSVERLLSMKKDVFGLGFMQFTMTAVAVAAVGFALNIPANALVVLGGGIALSSSAFVLQLLKDNNQLATRFGKAAFGILLFQDLAVVPLLVVTPILAGGGQGLASALFSASLKAGMALSSIAFAGRVLVNPLFRTVAQANSQEAFLGVVLLTVLSMSFMTEGLGLSNTLGAFLAGVLLSETKYRYQIEADIAPFRGILLGLFFVTVGFEIDFNLIASNLPLVSSVVAGIMVIKTAVIALLSRAFGLSLSTAIQTGLILSQGGEFAFVAFGLARSLGILDPAMTKLMLTSVALTMAATPFLAQLGGKVAKVLEERSDFTHYLGQDRDANEIRETDDFVVVVGYGVVGKLVCDLLDTKLFRYVGLEINPNKAIEARNKGLPVFYGDIGRPEVADAFGVGSAKAIIVTIADKDEANRAVISLRRKYPDKKIFARAADPDHAERLQRTLDVIAMVPVVPEDNLLLILPFGGAVLRSLGAAQEEVNAIIENQRKQILAGRGLEDDDQQMILAQLGILTADDMKKNNKEKEVETASSSEKALAAAEEKKSSSPMLAEVIEAAVTKSSPENESERDGDDMIDIAADVQDAEIVDENKAIKEGKEEEEVRA